MLMTSIIPRSEGWIGVRCPSPGEQFYLTRIRRSLGSSHLSGFRNFLLEPLSHDFHLADLEERNIL